MVRRMAATPIGRLMKKTQRQLHGAQDGEREPG
jgi:hypothetical protein